MFWDSHDYQRTAASFLLTNLKCGLFLDPGLGKTSITLVILKILKFLKGKSGIKGTLLIAPLRVANIVWPDEIHKWSNFNNITYTILHGKSKINLWGSQKDIYLINPEGLPWLFEELRVGLQSDKRCPFDTLWVDESTKFKSHKAKTRFVLIKDMLPLFKRTHIMTGTPSPRGLLDLWSQIYILDEGKSLCNNFYHFRKKYFVRDDWDKRSWYLKDGADKLIHKAISHLILDMSSDDYLDLPDLIYNYIKVELPPKAFKYYKRMERDFFIELDGLEASAGAAAQASMKCHQIANGNIYEDIPEDLDNIQVNIFKRNRKTIHIHTAKIEALKDLVGELNGKSLLIAYHFKHDLEALKLLFGEDVPYIGSGVSTLRQQEIEDRWNKGQLPILLGNPACMAHGLNLQYGGNDICWFSLIWPLEDYMQFNRRIYRQGVKGSVRIHHLVANNTVDCPMITRLGERAETQQNLRKALKHYRLTVN